MKHVVQFLNDENTGIWERYTLAMDRIALILKEETVSAPYLDYFRRYASFLLQLRETAESVKNGKLYLKSLKTLQSENQMLYADILPDAYKVSYADPAFSMQCFGAKYGPALSLLAAELYSMTQCAYEYRLYEITIAAELFISIYNVFENLEEASDKEIKNLIYYYVHDYCDDFISRKVRDTVDPGYTFAKDIIMESDLSKLSYLYYYGVYITENELQAAEFLNAMKEEEIIKMARTYVDGYVRGFQTMGIDFGRKSIVQVFYTVGFERMIKYALMQLEAMGKQVVLAKYNHHTVIRTPATRKMGYHAVSVNLQYEYDHRFDVSLVINKKIMDRMLKAYKNAYDANKAYYAELAGPAVQQAFGEPSSTPVLKKEACKRDKRQQKLYINFNTAHGILYQQYVKQEETSFTIIAYPLPSIGKDYPEIFKETVRLNNLDNALYQKIQQHIIDALDTGSYVKVVGAGNNQTDLKIMLHPLSDPSKETNFENCTADVNIPVGEVFTSPVLKGTCGTLHVGEIFINGFCFKDLKLVFSDGLVTSFTCGNFEKEADNVRFVSENIMKDHAFLPMGEFAIGTNTTAYAMAEKYKIQEKLPILIAEKTGPHFAVGDTCYARSEEHKIYNPDGKEMIARDNACSMLRNSDIEKAYFNCHTDITIPYHEILEISVYGEGTKKIRIIEDARFVLPGTEKLNDAFL